MDYFWELIELAKHNQFLVGGVATVALSALMYAIRSIPGRIYIWLRRSCSIEFTITTRNEHYEQFVQYLNVIRLPLFSRNYTVGQYTSKVVPGYGLSFGWFQGRLVIFTRHMLEGKGDRLNEKISITLFTRKASLLRSFVKAATVVPDRYQNHVKMFSSMGTDWRSNGFKRKRDLSSVLTSGTVKEDLIAKIEWFKANEDWYIKRGIPYKFCFCLHDIPGTGKTSLLRAVASHFNSNIRYVNSLFGIDGLLATCDESDMVVIEDIDTLAKLDRKKRSADEDEPSLGNASTPAAVSESLDEFFDVSAGVLHKVLNSLDGFQSAHGMVVGITTNHLTDLDPALRRVGRIDYLAELGPLEQSKMEDMFALYYSGEAAQKLLDAHLQQFGYSPISGARLQEVFSRPMPEEALEMLQDIEAPRGAFQVFTSARRISQ